MLFSGNCICGIFRVSLKLVTPEKYAVLLCICGNFPSFFLMVMITVDLLCHDIPDLHLVEFWYFPLAGPGGRKLV